LRTPCPAARRIWLKIAPLVAAFCVALRRVREMKSQIEPSSTRNRASIYISPTARPGSFMIAFIASASPKRIETGFKGGASSDCGKVEVATSPLP